MPDASSFDYAVVRVVPRVDREEFLNAGIIVFCATQDRLLAKVELDEARLRAFAPEVDVELVRQHLEAVPRVGRGGKEAGPIGALSAKERFHWLVSPRSTIVQSSAVHSGLCEDVEAVLERLMDQMVRPPTSSLHRSRGTPVGHGGPRPDGS